MSSLLGSIWPILSSYRPNAGRGSQTKKETLKFGTFEATYVPPKYGIQRPRTDQEAQRLYNHIRTVAFWLDAAPLLSDLGLPFRAGLDDIISLVPFYGDIVSGFLQLYQVWLSFIFGVPFDILGWMIVNVVLDVVVGIIPIIGDFIDNLWKSNLRNLALLETWLLENPNAERYHILLMPESQELIPKAKARGGGWFGGRADTAEDVEREKERRTGKVRRTRRMEKSEGVPVPMSTTTNGHAPESSPRAGQ